MSYAAALPGLNAAVLDTFGDAEVDLDGTRFYAIFDRAAQLFDTDGVPFSGPQPVLYCLAEDVSGIANGTELSVNEDLYTVREVRADDGDMVMVLLRSA